MKIISKSGDPNLAEVFVAQFRSDPQFLAEFVDSKETGIPREDKWVIIVSTQFGCPVECLMCDSGGNYLGNLTKEDIFAQIDHVVSQYQTGLASHCRKLKIQFARMGEPALNPAVLDVICELPKHYDNPALIPCIATTAPISSSKWFEELLGIKRTLYCNKTFQLQFSINSTNEDERDRLMPIPKWNLKQIAEYGMRFVENGDRKISLNFALTEGVLIDADIIAQQFDPSKFCIKVTPLNPTETASINQLTTSINPPTPPLIKGGEGGFVPFFKEGNVTLPFEKEGVGGIRLSHNSSQFITDLRQFGFDVIISIGEPRENEIGSNCGQAIRKLRSLTHPQAIK